MKKAIKAAYYPGDYINPLQLISCCCLLLAGFIIGLALLFCGLLDFRLFGMWLFLMLAIACCSCCIY